MSDESKFVAAVYRDNSIEVCEQLIAQGADIQRHGGKALERAAKIGNLELIIYLLDKNVYLESYWWVVGYAVDNSRVVIVQFLVDINKTGSHGIARGSIFKDTNEYIWRALRAGQYSEDVMDILVKNGGPDTKNIISDALSGVVRYSNEFYIVKSLVERYGADVTFGGGNAISYAAEYGAYESVKYFLYISPELINVPSSLYRAAEAGKFRVIKLLVERGAEIIIEDADVGCFCPFFPLLLSKEYEMLEYLLEKCELSQLEKFVEKHHFPEIVAHIAKRREI